MDPVWRDVGMEMEEDQRNAMNPMGGHRVVQDPYGQYAGHPQMQQRWDQQIPGDMMGNYGRAISAGMDERGRQEQQQAQQAAEWHAQESYGMRTDPNGYGEDALGLSLASLNILGRLAASPVMGTSGMLLPCGIRNELTDVMNYMSRLVALLRRPHEFMRLLAVAGEGFTLQLHPLITEEQMQMAVKEPEVETQPTKRRRRSKRANTTGDSSLWPYLSTKDMIDRARKEIRKYACQYPYAHGLEPPPGVPLPPSLASESGLVVVACLNKEMNVPLPAETHAPVNTDLVSSMKMIVRTYAGGLHQYYVGHLLVALMKVMKDLCLLNGSIQTSPENSKLFACEAEAAVGVITLETSVFFDHLHELRLAYKDLIPTHDLDSLVRNGYVNGYDAPVEGMQAHGQLPVHEGGGGGGQGLGAAAGGGAGEGAAGMEGHHDVGEGMPMEGHDDKERKMDDSLLAEEVIREIVDLVVQRVGDAICIYLHRDTSYDNPLKVVLWRALKEGTNGSVTQRKLLGPEMPTSMEDYISKVPVASEAALAVRILSLFAKRAADFQARLRHPSASVSASSAAGLGVPIDQRENRSLFKSALEIVEARRQVEAGLPGDFVPYDENNPTLWLRPANRRKEHVQYGD